MKNVYRILLFVILFFSSSILSSQNSSSSKDYKLELEEINKLIGKWTGSLTYLDYSSGNLYPMPCDLMIDKKRNIKKLVLHYIFPNEPKANSKEKITFSKDRSLINKKRILSKSINSEGQIEIYTENSGKDGNEGKKATIRNIYKIGDSDFIMRKEVKFEGTDEWIMRNEFKFKKTTS